jgi:hypothetical protein
LQVVCFSTYLTTVVLGWRPLDHDAHKFIAAIKDRDINGFAHVRVRNHWLRFDNANRQDVVGWFGVMVGDYFEAARLPRRVALVPLPGSKCDVTFNGQVRTATIAHACAATLTDATVHDVLRWQTPMSSAHEEGGTRDPQELFDNLTVRGGANLAPVVLVDDVLASGGHLRACAALLHRTGARVVGAVCAGRADDRQVDDPFAVRVEELEAFRPGG